jgi:hypothetical protein
MPSSIPKFYVSDPILISSSYDDRKDENPPLLGHLPLIGSIEHEPTSIPQLSRWVCATSEATCDLVGDPTEQCHTHSQFY